MKKKESANTISVEWFPAFKKSSEPIIADKPMHRPAPKPAPREGGEPSPASGEPSVTPEEAVSALVATAPPARLPRSAAWLIASASVATVWGIKAALSVPARQRGTAKGYSSFVKAFSKQRDKYRDRYCADGEDEPTYRTSFGKKSRKSKAKRTKRFPKLKKMKKVPYAPKVKAYKPAKAKK